MQRGDAAGPVATALFGRALGLLGDQAGAIKALQAAADMTAAKPSVQGYSSVSATRRWSPPSWPRAALRRRRHRAPPSPRRPPQPPTSGRSISRKRSALSPSWRLRRRRRPNAHEDQGRRPGRVARPGPYAAATKQGEPLPALRNAGDAPLIVSVTASGQPVGEAREGGRRGGSAACSDPPGKAGRRKGGAGWAGVTWMVVGPPLRPVRHNQAPARPLVGDRLPGGWELEADHHLGPLRPLPLAQGFDRRK